MQQNNKNNHQLKNLIQNKQEELRIFKQQEIAFDEPPISNKFSTRDSVCDRFLSSNANPL